MDTCLSGGKVFYSYTTILSLHVAYNLSLCSIWDTLWRDHVVTGNAAIMMEPHMSSAILPLPRDRKLTGDAIF
jgi:hypothetical protein